LRHVAFLRAINVGGRTARMDRLRRLFTELGFKHVETLIASGNVLFTPGRQRAATLERRIEDALADALGFEVTTFVRTAAELTGLQSAVAVEAPPGTSLLVGFLKSAPDPAAVARVRALRTDVDDLAVLGRELWWTRRGRISESKLGGGALERALGAPMTMRSINTVRRLALLAAEKGAGDGE
jgi:uncharacterized protein (DUF1697 family)